LFTQEGKAGLGFADRKAQVLQGLNSIRAESGKERLFTMIVELRKKGGEYMSGGKDQEKVRRLAPLQRGTKRFHYVPPTKKTGLAAAIFWEM